MLDPAQKKAGLFESLNNRKLLNFVLLYTVLENKQEMSLLHLLTAVT